MKDRRRNNVCVVAVFGVVAALASLLIASVSAQPSTDYVRPAASPMLPLDHPLIARRGSSCAENGVSLAEKKKTKKKILIGRKRRPGSDDGDGGGDDDAGGKGRPSPSRTSSYDPFFSRFYAWDQTRGHVIVAVRLPTGDADRGLRVEVAETAVASGDGDEGGFSPPSSPSSPSSRPTHRLLVAADGAPPVIDRVLSRAVARGGASSSPSDPLRHSPPVLVRRSADKRALLLTVAKAVPGELWPCLFLGDSLGARCVDPPYAVREGSGSGSGRSSRGSGENNDDDDDDENSSPSAAADGAVVEVELCPRLLPLPAWVEKRHISVETTVEKLSVRVEGLFELERYFW